MRACLYQPPRPFLTLAWFYTRVGSITNVCFHSFRRKWRIHSRLRFQNRKSEETTPKIPEASCTLPPVVLFKENGCSIYTHICVLQHTYLMGRRVGEGRERKRSLLKVDSSIITVVVSHPKHSQYFARFERFLDAIVDALSRLTRLFRWLTVSLAHHSLQARQQ